MLLSILCLRAYLCPQVYRLPLSPPQKATPRMPSLRAPSYVRHSPQQSMALLSPTMTSLLGSMSSHPPNTYDYTSSLGTAHSLVLTPASNRSSSSATATMTQASCIPNTPPLMLQRCSPALLTPIWMTSPDAFALDLPSRYVTSISPPHSLTHCHLSPPTRFSSCNCSANPLWH